MNDLAVKSCSHRVWAGKAARAVAPVAMLLLVVCTFWLASDAPLTVLDLRIVAVHTIIVGTAAIGMTLVIIAGGIDLSIGSAVALSGVIGALALKQGWSLPVAVAATIATGAACGLYNGVLVSVLRLPAFIATLGTLGFFRGVAKWLAGSRPVNAPADGLERLVEPTPRAAWMVVAPGVWIMLGLGVLAAFFLHRTVFGRRIVAVGSNEEAARRCAVQVPRVRAGVFVLAGAFAGIAGLFQFARLTQGDPTVASGLELDVIAAVVIGGASLSGGSGSLAGAIAGAALMAFLRNRSAALGWPNFVQEMIVGHIVIIAVAIDRWGIRRPVS